MVREIEHKEWMVEVTVNWVAKTFAVKRVTDVTGQKYAESAFRPFVLVLAPDEIGAFAAGARALRNMDLTGVMERANV